MQRHILSTSYVHLIFEIVRHDMTGMIHPVFFACYQITAGILLSGIVIKAFNRIKAFGVAA